MESNELKKLISKTVHYYDDIININDPDLQKYFIGWKIIQKYVYLSRYISQKA